MGVSRSPSEQQLGFLTVVEDPAHGLFGGYLLLNRTGRPLQFHCTAPVRANRAQEILYGPTLRPYLYGEQIGRTLLEQVKTQPIIVLTDREAMLAVGEFVSAPVALVTTAGQADSAGSDDPSKKVWRVDRGHRSPEPHWRQVAVGDRQLAVPVGSRPLDQSLVEDLAAVAASWDLAEPFDRIRAAIDEARRGGQ